MKTIPVLVLRAGRVLVPDGAQVEHEFTTESGLKGALVGERVDDTHLIHYVRVQGPDGRVRKVCLSAVVFDMMTDPDTGAF